MTDPRVSLPGGPWTLWRWACLRGAGFGAKEVLRLGNAALTLAAARLLEAEEDDTRLRQAATAELHALKETLLHDRREGTAPKAERAREAMKHCDKVRRAIGRGEVPDAHGLGEGLDALLGRLGAANERLVLARKAFADVFANVTTQISNEISLVTKMPRFREAVTWQNRKAVRSALDPLGSNLGERRNTHDRQHEELVASYLQRYATKNDSIGFFGPVGWAKLASSGPPLTVTPGPTIVAARSVQFEQWAIDEVARAIGKDARLEPWLAPRRLAFVRIDGATAHSPVNGRHELGPARAALLAACDGQTTARALSARFATLYPAAFPSEGDVLQALRVLRDKTLISFCLEIPLVWDGHARLGALLERIEDTTVRDAATAKLEALLAAHGQVGAAAGDANKLDEALERLDVEFERVTGRSATRSAGEMYAARTLVFEDCRRDAEVVIGPGLVASLGPTLSLLLRSARWLTFEVAAAYRAAFKTLHGELAASAQSRSVPFEDFWKSSQRLFYGQNPPTAPLVAELRRRWSAILDCRLDQRVARYTSEALAHAVGDAFAAPRPGWPLARYQCPDVMIAARSVDAINAGDCLYVLGELHVATNTIDFTLFANQHPSPAELLEAVAHDIPEARVIPAPNKGWPRVTVRALNALLLPKDRYLETGLDAASVDPTRVLRAADLVVVDTAGRVEVRSADGRVCYEIVDFFAETLSSILISGFGLLPKSDHTPRVIIDQLVVSRESWYVPASEIPVEPKMSEQAAYLALYRWAQARGMPRFVFVKAAFEVKPTYVDFASPIYVAQLARVVRRAKEREDEKLAISEMLPSSDELWLTDAQGTTYTSELRLVCVDSLEGDGGDRRHEG